ncbi:alanine-phosphoribitol ligase, partial [Paracidovorax avenae]
PDQIRAGKVMSSQCMFDPALQVERDLGINHWEAECPPVEGIGFAVPNPEQAGARLIDWSAKLDQPAQSVDQRLKMPVWLENLEKRGGKVLIQDAGIAELEALSDTHDLVILAAGKG